MMDLCQWCLAYGDEVCRRVKPFRAQTDKRAAKIRASFRLLVKSFLGNKGAA